ncbi:MAG: ParB N-terminal domain-containing protein [Candidatus Bathyarchaeota archaeon]|nr:ParB N-terminal domain-containing protein [Candidatus Bathyarchaeota archaeon]MDW8040106.1 ParB N-terminal domain-containing protein [Nitrososphaerota archaeon]
MSQRNVKNGHAENSQFKIVFLPIETLKPHEKGSPLYLELLKQEILKDGVLKYPIIADEKSLVILDGMHRWLALQSLGYKKIPVLLVDALENPKIRIGSRRVHRYVNGTDIPITAKEVISAGLSGRLLEPRTTRHFFPFMKPPRIDCPLDSLKKSVPQDVSRYLAEMTPEECRKAIKGWLEELSEELDFLKKRIEEVEKEREEFLARIKSLSNNHFF